MRAGNLFKEATQVVHKDVRFAIMVGNIFTEEKMYDDAEKIYDLAIEVWDKEDKYPPLMDVAEYDKAIDGLFGTIAVNTNQKIATKMVALHKELRELIFGATPDYYQAMGKIQDIRKLANAIKTQNMAKVPTDKTLTALKEAIEFRYYLLNVKRNLVLAKVANKKWDEALSLLKVLLDFFKNDASFKVLKGDVHLAMAREKFEAKESFDKAKADLEIVDDIAKKLTKIKSTKLPTFSRKWWDAMGLYYQAEGLKHMFKRDDKAEFKKAAKTLKHIKLWQNNKRFPPDKGFMDRTNETFEELTAAGFTELGLSKAEIEKRRKEDLARAARMRTADENDARKVIQKVVSQIKFMNGNNQRAEAEKEAAEIMRRILNEMAEPEATKAFLKEMQGYYDTLKALGFKEAPAEEEEEAPAKPTEEAKAEAKPVEGGEGK
jgi:tetratricopeptide (TPR) repeat protein